MKTPRGKSPAGCFHLSVIITDPANTEWILLRGFLSFFIGIEFPEHKEHECHDRYSYDK